MALTEEQIEDLRAIGDEWMSQDGRADLEDFITALPKPDPVGNLNNGKFFWNTKGGPDKWRDRQNYDGPLYAEAPITQPASDYDLSGVIHLTHNKTKSIVGRGYKITGFVLTDETGRKCISDMSAVRWFDERVNFFRMMHPDNNPLPASAPSEQKAVAWNARHLKTGNIYEVLGEAIDSTNGHRGQTMVIYQRDGKTFVREAKEFIDKFEATDEIIAPQPDYKAQRDALLELLESAIEFGYIPKLPEPCLLTKSLTVIAGAKGDKCKTCNGQGGWEVAASSTSYFWKDCPDCSAIASVKGGA